MGRKRSTARMSGSERLRRGQLISLVAVALASASLLAGASSASAELAPALGTPTPVTTGVSVQWRPVAFESSYEVAISNDPRVTPQRATRYLTIERTPGEIQSYAPPLAPGETVYVGVSANGGVTWSEQEATITAPSSQPEQTSANATDSAPALAVLSHAVVWNTIPGATSYKVALSNSARGTAGRATRYVSIAPVSGEVQFYTPALTPGETTYVGVSADGGVTWSEQEVTVSAPSSKSEQTPEAEATPETTPTPTPEPEPESQPGPEPESQPTSEPESESESEELESEELESESQPNTEPGLTPEAKTEPAPTSVRRASIPTPTLSVRGQTLKWTAVPKATSYDLATIARLATGQEKTYKTLTGTSFTPPVLAGQQVGYRIAANVAGTRGKWSAKVSITYSAAVANPPGGTKPKAPSPPEPSPPTVTEPPAEIELPTPPPIGSGKIIGTNDGSGWGAVAAKTILGGHITWDRIELGGSSQAVTNSLSDGFHVLGIVGNLADGTPLSSAEPSAWAAEVVSQLKANPGISIAEAGNEMYYKGKVANPVQYGRMYLAAVEAMKAAGIRTPLLFNMFGSYGNSSDGRGGGWLHDAVAGVPGLAAAIRANGLSSHPYGALNENWEDINGVLAVVGQEAVALSVLGAIPPIYITEFGYSLNNCGEFIGACSQQEQATKMRAAYSSLLADPHVAGIWWYQSHDDSIGQYGFMNNDNTTRPSFATLSSIAIEQGQ
jgi:hypothetical protein